MFVLDKHHMAYRSTKDQRTPKHRFCPKDKLITSQDQEQEFGRYQLDLIQEQKRLNERQIEGLFQHINLRSHL